MISELRILIADDDDDSRTGAGELLSPFGAEILTASDGREALDIVRTTRVSLALLDVHMPALDGLEVMGELLRSGDPIPCILWSADAAEEVRQYALRRGARAFLRKPVEPDLLRTAVRRILDEAQGAA